MTVHQQYLSLETALLTRVPTVDDRTLALARDAVLARVGRCDGLVDAAAAAEVLAALGISPASRAADPAGVRGR